MQTKSQLHKAILLIGPTGSGKTPLGEYTESVGLGCQRCLHFDFGQQLRLAASQDPAQNGLDAKSTNHIRDLLANGALLEDDAFHIAENILLRFMARRTNQADDMIVLNGLPRHAGQAQQVERLLRITTVINLECPPAVVFSRIRNNSGGDRTGRHDDSQEKIRQKLAVFEARTAPLLAYYSQQQVPVITHTVSLQDEPAALWATLSAAISTAP